MWGVPVSGEGLLLTQEVTVNAPWKTSLRMSASARTENRDIEIPNRKKVLKTKNWTAFKSAHSVFTPVYNSPGATPPLRRRTVGGQFGKMKLEGAKRRCCVCVCWRDESRRAATRLNAKCLLLTWIISICTSVISGQQRQSPPFFWLSAVCFVFGCCQV